MKASKITHRNETRIRLDFPYDQEQVSKLRQITDTRWSNSLKCWHVPYTKEVLEQLKEFFPEAEYTSTQNAKNRDKILPKTTIEKKEVVLC